MEELSRVLDLDILNVILVIISIISGLFGVFLGSKLNRKTSIDIQKKFLAKQIRLDKLQGVSEGLADLIHEFLELNIIVSNRVNNNISEGEFENLSHNQFQKVMRMFKDVQIKDLFLEEDYRRKIEKLKLKYTKVFNQTQIDFLKDENIKRKELGEIVTKSMEEVFYICDFAFQISHVLNEEIERELKELE